MVSGVELIRRYTLLGLYGPAMHMYWWGSRCEGELADGQKPKKFSRRLGPPGPLAWCPTCCREDFLRFGWAPWRVVHQVPFLHHCPDHGTSLLTFCADCHEPLDRGFHWRLPGDACRKCNGSTFRPAFIVEQNPGYQGLLRVAAKLNRAMMVGEALSYRWDVRRDLPDPEILRLVWTLRGQLAPRWGVEHESSIPKLLGVPNTLKVFSQVRQLQHDCPLTALLSISLFAEFT